MECKGDLVQKLFVDLILGLCDIDNRHQSHNHIINMTINTPALSKSFLIHPTYIEHAHFKLQLKDKDTRKSHILFTCTT